MQQGLLQRELAEAIGVDETSIYNWENSRTRPKGNYIEKLEEYFSSSFDNFTCVLTRFKTSLS
jgi:transcriptional regulator with XRE-family HTH domain